MDLADVEVVQVGEFSEVAGGFEGSDLADADLVVELAQADVADAEPAEAEVVEAEPGPRPSSWSRPK